MYIFCMSQYNIIIFGAYEWIGIISYFLINTHSVRSESNKSCLFSLIIGKIGDIGVIYTIITLLVLQTSVLKVLTTNSSISRDIDIKISILTAILIAIMSKSVQFILLTWIVLAMNGPIPVSSLLLSSTLVTTGVWFIHIFDIKSSYLYNHTGFLNSFLIGIYTISVFDTKKLIAWSTSTQISLIFVGINLYNTNGLFLIHTLAFIKAFLFMSFGLLILYNFKIQDLRYFKLSLLYSPFFLILVHILFFSISAFPLLSCFYSKEATIESIYGLSGHYVAFCSSMLTIIYIIKVILIY